LQKERFPKKRASCVAQKMDGKFRSGAFVNCALLAIIALLLNESEVASGKSLVSHNNFLKHRH
jgi:hypothetical protein